MTNETARRQFDLVRVLVVHDDAFDLSDVYAALRKEFVVRVATTTADAVDLARSLPLGCVVCMPGRGVRAREVHAALLGACAEAPGFVFLRGRGVEGDDAVFVLTSGERWLPLPIDPGALVGAVRGASQSR